MASTRTKAITLAGSPAFHPPGSVARHAASLGRRQARLSRDRDAGASPEILVAHEAEVVRLTKVVRRSQKRVDRLAVLHAEAADRAAKRADNDELKARLAAKEEAENEAAKDLCKVVIDRIQAREAEKRSRLKLETRADRRRKSLQRKNPHTERDTTISLGRRYVTDPTRLGGFVEVQVNRQLDVLTTEHSRGRVSDQEFAVGRLLQDAWTGNGEGADRRLERMIQLGILSNGANDEDLAPREMGMLREVFRVRAVAQLDAKLASVVGWVGVRFLKAILVEGHTLCSYATCTVGGGERGTARVGDRFRWLLEAVTDSLHTAEGSRRPVPQDIYQADADTVPARVAALKARAEAAKEAAPSA